jgi:PAS domain-containing protein
MVGDWMMSAGVLGASVVATSVGSAMIALSLISMRASAPVRRKTADLQRPVLEETAFLFDDLELIDATAPARALLEAVPGADGDWTRLTAYLAPRFDGLTKSLDRLPEMHSMTLVGPEREDGTALRLKAEYTNGLTRLTLIDPGAEGQGLLVDVLSQRALEEELGLLRQASDRLPALAWRENAAGEVTWANRAYILRSEAYSVDSDTFVWPLPRIFEIDQNSITSTKPRRLKLEQGDEKNAWFDCHSYMLDKGVLHFAMPADAIVRAERALRDFVQTLTKTFAELPIGLAIFDRQRQMQLFNPALIDLLGVAPEFMSGRPTLYAFLDRLRETRMMPEPKDYRSWRQQMAELEQASAAGHHSETWTLPSGQTYRVTGRPHPDGAVAFLFEDISSEVSLTRRFRAELELGQEVIDALPQAMAVFLSSGELVTSNIAYAELWGVDPGATLGQMTAIDALRTWQLLSEPNPIWAEARDYLGKIGPRAVWTAEARMQDGRRLGCRFAPLAGGSTLASFSLLEADAPVVPKTSGFLEMDKVGAKA